MSDFLCDRIAITEQMIVVYEDAILALIGDNAVQSYTLDTGQTKQTVMKSDISKLQDTLDTLYNRYTVLRARCGFGGTVTVGAAW